MRAINKKEGQIQTAKPQSKQFMCFTAHSNSEQLLYAHKMFLVFFINKNNKAIYTVKIKQLFLISKKY